MTLTDVNIVDVEIVDAVAVVTIDSPPVNLGNARLRAGLVQAFDEIGRTPSVRAVVLRSALEDFYAGSDLHEFDGEIADPELPAVIARMDALTVPIVAALGGHTLGGGLELALAADARIAAPDLRIGFPETELGMVPGAGGTVRASRLVGVPATIGLVATARRLDAPQALEHGLIDEIVGRDRLLERALHWAFKVPRRRLLEAPVPPSSRAEIEEAVGAAVNRRTRPHVLQAIEMIRAGAAVAGTEALVAERELFTELRAGAEARALRHLFFAKSAAAKSIRAHGPARPVGRIGIAGAGTMGSSIALAAARAGWQVRVFDTNPDVLDRARARLADARVAALFSGGISVLADADLVIDAVYEEVEVKRSLLRELNGTVRPDTVIASNTSYLDLDDLARDVVGPWRFGGVHFFNPADRNPLVEIVRCAQTSEATLATLGSVVRRLGKTAVPARVGDGFVANRVYADYRQQAELLLEDGASPAEVDQAMQSFGMAVGPFAVGDMSGLDIAWARRRRLAAARDPRQRYVAIPDLICEQGRLGRKTGAGYYDYYPDGQSRGAESPLVASIIADERARKGIAPRPIPEGEIVQRCVSAMVLAAAELVAQGIAERPTDIDLALVEGFAFPRWRGGPLHYATTRPRPWLIEGLRSVYRSDPVGFAGAAAAESGNLPLTVERLLT